MYNPCDYQVIVPRHSLCESEIIFGTPSTSSQHLNNAIYDWLQSEVGFQNWERTVQDNIRFYFKYEEDKVKFILRWL